MTSPGRRLRSAVAKERGVQRPEAPKDPGPGGGTIFRQATCPVCGMNRGFVREMAFGVVLARRNAWEFEHDPDKPFGVVKESAGRGTMRSIGHFGPDADPDGYFPLVKGHLLAAVGKWVASGWITEAELNAAVAGLVQHFGGPENPSPIAQSEPPAGSGAQTDAEVPAATLEVLQGEVEALHQKISGRQTRNSLLVAKELETLEQKELQLLEAAGEDVRLGSTTFKEALDAVEDFRALERSDFGSAEEFSDARTDAWNAILEAIDEITIVEDSNGS